MNTCFGPSGSCCSWAVFRRSFSGCSSLSQVSPDSCWTTCSEDDALVWHSGCRSGSEPMTTSDYKVESPFEFGWRPVLLSAHQIRLTPPLAGCLRCLLSCWCQLLAPCPPQSPAGALVLLASLASSRGRLGPHSSVRAFPSLKWKH